MATYTPPTEILPIFDSSVYQTDATPLTVGEANKKYIKYPTAQGLSTFPSGIKTNSIANITPGDDMTIGADSTNINIGSTGTGTNTYIRSIYTRQIRSSNINGTNYLFYNIDSGATLNIGNNSFTSDPSTLINIFNNVDMAGNVLIEGDVQMNKSLQVNVKLSSSDIRSINAADAISLFQQDVNGNYTTGSITIGDTGQSACVINPPAFFNSGVKLNTIDPTSTTSTCRLWDRSGNITIGNITDSASSYVLSAKPFYVNHPITYNGASVPSLGTSPASTQLGGWFSGTRSSVSITANTNNLVFTLPGGTYNGLNICNITVTISGTPTIVTPTNFVVYVTKTSGGASSTAQSGGLVSIPIFSGAIPTLPYNVSFSTYLDQTPASYCYIRLDCTSVTGLNYSGSYQKIRLA
jgi:hypothetical protein